MSAELPYSFLADLVLLVHFGLVVFVVGGLVLILAGNAFEWAWVNGLWFRLCHLAAIVVVAAQSWLDIACPLTTLESWLRTQAGEIAYDGSFIEYWLQRFLFYEAPPWVFVSVYTLFGLLVAAAWWYFPPKRRRSRS